MGVSENSVPLNPMVLLIIIPMKNGYFIGNIPYFQTNPYASLVLLVNLPIGGAAIGREASVPHLLRWVPGLSGAAQKMVKKSPSPIGFHRINWGKPKNGWFIFCNGTSYENGWFWGNLHMSICWKLLKYIPIFRGPNMTKLLTSIERWFNASIKCFGLIVCRPVDSFVRDWNWISYEAIIPIYSQ